MAKEATNYLSDSIPEDWKDEIWADLNAPDGYKKYFTVDGHDDPYCTQQELEFWVLEKEEVMPNGWIHDEIQEKEEITLEEWVAREGIMEIPGDLDHGIETDTETAAVE